jgi:hypothetical protein
VNVSTFNLSHSNQSHRCNCLAIAHDLNPVLTPSCLKKIAGINTINAWTLNTLTMICFYGYKHNFMLVL